MSADSHQLGWTAERVARLKQLWAYGWSCSRIGDDLGVTRNAAIGKLHRMKDVERRPNPTVKKEPRQPSPKVRAADVVASPMTETTPGGSKALLDLASGDCRYPYGNGPFLFCAAAALPESPYCAFHRSVCHEGKVRPPIYVGRAA